MRCTLLAVAGRPSGWVAEATDGYLRRLPRAWRVAVELLAPSRRQTAAARRDDEWTRLQARLPADAETVLLDERGRTMTSRQLSKRFGSWLLDGRDVCFVIGGPDGFAKAAREHAGQLLSLSAMTLPHELARVVLVEQLYRAHSILEGHPYHRD